MKLFGKARNVWGRVRIGSLAAVAVGLVLTLLAVALRVTAFSALDGFELVTAALLVGLLAGWLEDQDHREAVEQEHHHGRQHAVRQAREALAHAKGPEMAETIQAALTELNGKGRGEVLHLLYEAGKLSGDETGLDVREMDFSGAVLRHADLRGARMAGCDLSRAKLEGARLQGADLTGAKLEEAFLKHANLTGCALEAESLDEAILIETIAPDGRKVTNEKGKAYLRSKEIAMLVDKL